MSEEGVAGLLKMLEAGRGSGHSTMEALVLLALASRPQQDWLLGALAEAVGATTGTVRPVVYALSGKGRVSWTGDGWRLTQLGAVVAGNMMGAAA